MNYKLFILINFNSEKFVYLFAILHILNDSTY